MAVQAATVTELKEFSDDGHLVVWTGLAGATSDTGAPVQMFGSSDRCVQMSGTFSSTTIVLEGSNDGTTYATLSDPGGTALSFTAAGLKQVLELPRYVRPRVSGGSGTLTCTLLMKLVR